MSTEQPSPFSRSGVLAIVVVGFAAFLAMLYFLSVGDTGPEDSNNGEAHAAANGLNGFSALVDLLEADGMDVTISREQGDLRTRGLLVLTPPRNSDAEELSKIIYARNDLGPTLVILPKWYAVEINQFMQIEDRDQVKDGWVMLSGTGRPNWVGTEYLSLSFELKEGRIKLPDTPVQGGAATKSLPQPRFTTRGPIAGISGQLPSPVGFHAVKGGAHTPLIVDQADRSIALKYTEPGGVDQEDEVNWVVFVIEPDLMNNWGVSDRTRALTALSLVRSMGYGYEEGDPVTFDLTLNGLGGAMNLLTLAFQPPFLAATICLLLAMLIVGWRAFKRFGPAAVRGRETAFGKAQLVTNGADLILRAGRLGLLAEPYINLSARRYARNLALPKPEHEAIDTALAQRQPQAPSFTARANALRAATKPADILRAARALNQTTANT